jgi:uncharacterized protein YlaN (UPF0358 family)
MDRILKIIRKLLDKFILPKYEDIVEYQITFNEEKIDIIFWMDGTDQETEEEIIYEIQSTLKFIGPIEYWIVYKFTVDGDNFYIYS